MRKSLVIRDWEKAHQTVHEWEAEGRTLPEEPQNITLKKASSDFLADAESRGLQRSTLDKYRLLVRQMREFSAFEGLIYIRQWEDVEVCRRFRHSWRDKGLTVVKKLERLRAFYRFAQDSGWIDKNPALKLKNPVVRQTPTMPFSHEEMVALLAACDQYKGKRRRLRALVLLMRYSGLRIGDAVRLGRDRIVGNRLFLYTQKTGVPVWCPLPQFVVDALNSFEPANKAYFFWSGNSSRDGIARTYMGRFNRLFKLAGIPHGHSHCFRDTFATELLLKGVPLERVSVMLGHSSIKVTEKHYSPWVRARQEQLEADVVRTWNDDPMILASGKGTPKVHRDAQVVN
jgi:integrase/recombinase XerD